MRREKKKFLHYANFTISLSSPLIRGMDQNPKDGIVFRQEADLTSEAVFDFSDPPTLQVPPPLIYV